ncbi:hypothetical protein RUM43_008070 [Polyplax serrata]|uniref:Uncharacterized protein n=1 Tax=Polyplax serrata TaxID=468196 RepID=A0AAN8S5X9_POLSC
MNTAGMTVKEADHERMNIFYGCLFKWKARVVLRSYIEKALGNSKLGEMFKASEQLSNEICKKSVGPPAPRPQPPCYDGNFSYDANRANFEEFLCLQEIIISTSNVKSEL